MKKHILIFSLLSTFFSSRLFAQSVGNELKISHLTGDFYIFNTYKMMGGGKQEANGMYMVTDKGVVLFDTPWDTCPFQPLLDSIQAKHHKKVIMCIGTHSHEDRTSGMDYYKKHGIKTFTTKQTNNISKAKGTPRAEFIMPNDTIFTVGNHQFQTYFAGQGHTKDNIVIWFNKEKILYGGCLVKSTAATDMGYVKESNLQEWPKTIKKLQAKFQHPAYIIPGHYDWTSIKSLDHTLELLKENEHKK